MMDTILSIGQEKKPQTKRYKRNERYHVTLGEKRTTVSLDNMLSILLSLKLGAQPESEEAHRVIRQWLQARLDESNDPGRILVSGWLQREATLYLVEGTALDKAYGEWILSQIDG